MTTDITTQDIAESLRARIAAVRAELERYDALREELARLEDALARLQPERTGPARRRSTSRSTATKSRAPASKSSPALGAKRPPRTSGPRSQTRERIIDFVRKHGPATAAEVASGLNLNRNSVATRLTQLAKAGELQKAERGYAVAAQNGAPTA